MQHMQWYLLLSRGDFEFFVPQGQHAVLNHTKYHPHWCRCRGGVWGPKTANFTKFWNINVSQWCIPCTIFIKYLVIGGATLCKFVHHVRAFCRLLSYSQILMHRLRIWNGSQNHLRSRWYAVHMYMMQVAVATKFCMQVKQVSLLLYHWAAVCCLTSIISHDCMLKELQKTQITSLFECQISKVTSALLYAWFSCMFA